MSNLTFTYTITGFDEANRVLSFSIEGEGERHIQVESPLPTTIEELEKQIKRWALHAEVVEAQQQPHDFSFISGFIGTPREAERFRRNPLLTAEPVPAEEPNPEGMAAEERAFIESIMRDHGLIQ